MKWFQYQIIPKVTKIGEAHDNNTLKIDGKVQTEEKAYFEANWGLNITEY